MIMGHSEKEDEMCLQKGWVDFFKGPLVSQIHPHSETVLILQDITNI